MTNSKIVIEDENLLADEELPAPVAAEYDGHKKAELERSRRSYKVRQGIEDFFEQRRMRALLGDDDI
jgi:hypothetical protein